MQLIAGVLTLVSIFLLGTLALPRVWSPNQPHGIESPPREISPEVRLALDHKREPIPLKNTRVANYSGDVAQEMKAPSNRKGIISLLYGVAVHQGIIELDKTMTGLNFDRSLLQLSK